MNSHFDVWAMILAIPAAIIMIAIIGKWLFTPIKPVSDQSSKRSAEEKRRNNVDNGFTYNTKYKAPAEHFHMHTH